MLRLIVMSALLLSCTSAAAQTAPPIQGVTGTIATDSTIRSAHRAAHKVAEGVAHGVKKILPGGNETDQDPLDALITGSRVTVQDVTDNGGGLKATKEGTVIDVNRSRKQITLRLADKKTETLRVMDATAPAGAHVVVSLTDRAGARTYDFKRVS